MFRFFGSVLELYVRTIFWIHYIDDKRNCVGSMIPQVREYLRPLHGEQTSDESCSQRLFSKLSNTFVLTAVRTREYFVFIQVECDLNSATQPISIALGLSVDRLRITKHLPRIHSQLNRTQPTIILPIVQRVRCIFIQRRICIVDIHSISAIRDPARNGIDPAVQEREAGRGIVAVEDGVVELELEERVAMSVGGCGV